MEREGALIYCHPPFHVKPWICWSIAPTAPTMYLTFPSLRPVPAVRTLKAVLPRSCLMEKIYMGKANSKMGFKNKNCLILLSSSIQYGETGTKHYFFKMAVWWLTFSRGRKAGNQPWIGQRLDGAFSFLFLGLVLLLFSVHEINTSKCFLVFHLFISSINILSLKKGSNVCS